MASESAQLPDHLKFNREHFDGIAHKYDEHPMAAKLASHTSSAMLASYPFDEETTSVLEFACGTGLVSRELAPHAKVIVGVDISQGMVDQYNLRVSNQGISAEEMHAECVELKGEEGELGGQKFDVVVCAQAYHHFPSIESVTKILAFFLKPGGALLVVDLIHTDESEELHRSHVLMVPHKGGFEEPHVRAAFDFAGLEQFSFKPVTKVTVNSHEMQLFFAKGVKPL
ncbi:S-adenosyl-L-methionine-dependent methyltransferase [Rickenella mellea]|uniref:S-adenosyl-L-methionine-dependent methyltransferase n=1 Tax=Rickenella mellea TaxID=50990 RepID=A0A4Y7PMD8_9AGAM|nr:S-adenosyl-L-methionine-dependent methyltransferase [Rickenella mellea]